MRKTSFIAILTILLTCLGMQAATPDFAYPRKSIEEAEKLMAAARTQAPVQSDLSRIEAAMIIATAETMIDPDTIYTVPGTYARQATESRTDIGRCIFALLEARTLAQIYNSSRWMFDQRKLPLEPYPDIVAEWSGEQLRARIDTLTEKSLTYLGSKALDTPLAECKGFITPGTGVFDCFDTLRDFVQLKAHDLLQDDNRKAALTALALAGSEPQSLQWFYWKYTAFADKSIVFKDLAQLYETYADVDNGRLLLYYLLDLPSYGERTPVLVKYIEDSLAKFPDNPLNPFFRNSLTVIKLPGSEIKLNSIVAPGKDFDVKLTYDYCKSAGLIVYKLPSDAYDFNSKADFAQKATVIKKISIDTDPDVYHGDTTLTLRLENTGQYVVVPMADGSSDQRVNDFDGQRLYCSTFVPILINNRGSKIGALAFSDGAPVGKVEIFGDRTSSRLGTTGTDGFATIDYKKLKGDWDQVYFAYNGEKYFFNKCMNIRKPHLAREGNRQNISCTFYTDRAIYKPGETVEWALICHDNDNTVEGKRLSITFRDANHQAIDTIEVVTDYMGNASGKFVVPDDRLTGFYSLNCNSADDDRNQYLGSGFLTVSDFHMPTFKAEVTSVKRDVPEKGCVTIAGRATTYSGMPVSQATVDVTIKSALRLRWMWSPDTTMGSVHAVTSDDGTFEVVVPADMLASSRSSYFEADITVTSPTHESVDITKNFATGKPYVVFANITQKICTDTPVANPIRACDADGADVAIDVKWTLTNKSGETVAQGVVTSGDRAARLDWENLKSEVCIFSYEPVDTLLADNYDRPIEIYLYSLKHNTLPDAKDIFCLEQGQRITTDDRRGAQLTVGIQADGTHLYIATSTNNNDTAVEHKVLKRGFHKIDVEIPRGSDYASVSLIKCSDGEIYCCNVDLQLPDKRKVTIEGESMRDRLQPGETEHWRLRFRDYEGKPLSGMAIATMYNQALESLASLHWSDKLYSLPLSYPNVVYGCNNLICLSHDISPVKTTAPELPALPQWLYGQETAPIMEYVMAFGSQKRMMSLNSVAGSAVVTDEAEMESSDDTDATLSFSEADEAAPADVQKKDDGDFDYRDADVYQAFWRPTVVINSDGVGEITFDVPNANATWIAKILAWTTDLRSASLLHTALANKPVMVQPKLPRFLRQGDKTRLLATVYNNTDDQADVTTVVELFDINNGRTTTSRTFTDHIAAGGSAIVGIDIEALPSTSALGYRVRSTLGTWTDGELTAIPVLASASTVIDSENFYLNPGQGYYELTIPDLKGMTTTLQYCQNPIWTIVRSLRVPRETSTSPGVADNLFGAMAARHISENSPAISHAIELWRTVEGDEGLVSMLSTNADLKALMLDRTPWVQTANSQTARMQALADLFAKANYTKEISKALDALGKLQKSDGGWAWGSWSDKSSVWVTETVLATLGIARTLGFYRNDKNLEKMIRRGITWYDGQFAKVETSRSLAWIHAMHPDMPVAPEIKKKIDATTAEIASKWKKYDSTDKAWSALILNAYGRKSEARDIIASLRQFAVPSPSRGLSFPSVNDIRGYATIIQAFTTIDPRTDELDAMRQWLIVRQQAMDDFGTCDPDYIVSAILLTGSDWTAVSPDADVTVDGVPLAMTTLDAAAGYLSARLYDDDSGLTLRIQGNGVAPSYGSVVSIGQRQMDAIEARPSADVKIEKRLLVERDGKWVEPKVIAPGERVQVVLTVDCRRSLEYVTVIDDRAAALEPVDQLPGYIRSQGVSFYRENLDASTRLFISYLPKGVYQLSYYMTAGMEGEFSGGPATIQSQYAPSITARSGAGRLTVAQP